MRKLISRKGAKAQRPQADRSLFHLESSQEAPRSCVLTQISTASDTDFAKNGLGHRPHVFYELFNGSLRKGILANENDNCPLQKFTVSVVHPVVSGAYTLALCDQIRCERTEETSYDQKFQ
jgi:hypothetical protein